jgi:hypothetical protein
MKPKMQMGPGEYITQEFRAEMDKWLIDFFGYEDDEPKKIVYHDANLQVKEKPKSKNKTPRTKVKRTQNEPDTETFAGLLEGLEDSFYSMQVPTMQGSWLGKNDVNAIKKMGIYVPTPMEIELKKVPTIPSDVPLIAIASAYFIPKKHNIEEKMYPRFAFCIKNKRLPESVEMICGTPYQFGLCYEFTKTEDDKEMKPKTFWFWCWMVVTPTGEIRIPNEMRQLSVSINHKRTKGGFKGMKGARQSTANLKRWCLPSIVVAEKNHDQSEHERFLKSTFRQLLLWWKRREDQWSVGVRKDGHRVTFSVAKEHTSAYFSDRDTVVNINGKPCKIVHYVREHRRSSGAVVKAHVRGLREFEWKGYHCVVTAPGFNGQLLTNLTIDPVDIEPQTTIKYMETEEVAVALANAEDRMVA